MASTDREQWPKDIEVLHEIARQLRDQDLRVEVRLPRALADQAVAAWPRDESGDADLDNEAPEQALVRSGAGTLGLIGLTLEQEGVQQGDQVVVRLEAWFIGDALESADRAGVLYQDGS